MIKKAVILCGGLATRFLPYTKSVPKEMLPILDRPAIDYAVTDLKNNGITDILIILGRNKESLENYYDRSIELEDRLTAAGKTKELESIASMYANVNIYFKRQLHAKGTGYALSLAKEFVQNEPFILVFPDELMLENSYAKQLIDAYNKTNSSILPLKQINITDSKKYGMVSFSSTDTIKKINKIIEKPEPKDSPSDICYLGGGLFTSDIFSNLSRLKPQPNGEIYLTDAFEQLIAENKLYGQIIQGRRIDFGNKLGFVKGNIMAGLLDPEISNELKDHIREIVKTL